MRSSEIDDALPTSEAPSSPWRREATIGLGAVLAFAALWFGAAGACFVLGDGGVGRFLGMPIGVYIAGQGLLMLAVVLIVRLTRA